MLFRHIGSGLFAPGYAKDIDLLAVAFLSFPFVIGLDILSQREDTPLATNLIHAN